MSRGNGLNDSSPEPTPEEMRQAARVKRDKAREQEAWQWALAQTPESAQLRMHEQILSAQIQARMNRA